MRRDMDVCTVGEQLAVDAVGVALLLDIPDEEVHRLHQAGQLPAPVRIGDQERWRVSDVRFWLEEGCPTTEKFTELLAEVDGVTRAFDLRCSGDSAPAEQTTTKDTEEHEGQKTPFLPS